MLSEDDIILMCETADELQDAVRKSVRVCKKKKVENQI